MEFEERNPFEAGNVAGMWIAVAANLNFTLFGGVFLVSKAMICRMNVILSVYAMFCIASLLRSTKCSWYFGRPHVRSCIFIFNIAFTESPVDYFHLSLSRSCQIASCIVMVNANTIYCFVCMCSDRSLPSCPFSWRLRNLALLAHCFSVTMKTVYRNDY